MARLPAVLIAAASTSAAWTSGAAAQAPAAEIVIRVAPAEGGAPGTVATLAEALARARAERARTPAATIAVEVGRGTHRVAAPVQITRADGGTPERPFVLRGASEGGARIAAAEKLAPATADPAVLALFPPAARGHVRAFALPARLTGLPVDVVRRADWVAKAMPFEIFDARGALRPARWPNAGFADGRAPVEAGISFDADRARAARWRQPGEIWLAGYMRWDWGYATQPVERVDTDTGRVVLREPPQYGFRDVPRYAVSHVAAELDEPGEWYRDPSSGRLYVWPRPDGGDIEASVAGSVLVVDGAAHVVVENLTLERSAADAVVVRGGRDVTVRNATVRWTGGRGVVLEGAVASTLSGSVVEDTGEGGVWLVGGDRAQLVGGALAAIDNRIERFARLGLASRAGVQLEGIGNRAVGNLITGSVAMAVGFRGNEHLIELNEITGVVTDHSDAGAVYTGRDFTAQGTIIRHNFIHGIKPGRPDFEVKGVYLDDQASGITIEGNLFLRVDQPVFLGGGRDNLVMRNVFLASEPAVHLDGRGQTWANKDLHIPDSEIMAALKAVPTRSLAWLERYPRLYALMEDQPERPKRNRVQGNLFLASAPYRILDEVNRAEQRIEAAPSAARGDASGPQVAAMIARLRTAADVRRELGEALARAGLADLPFAAMDRAAVAGRAGAR